jgi:hypothetical protein
MLDSAALHARSLFEFLSMVATPNHYGANNFLGGTKIVESRVYLDDWKGPLHAYLMHLQPRPGRRRKLRTRASARKKLPLNRMPVEFAEEIIDLWKRFVKKLRNNHDSLAVVAEKQLARAIDDARCVRTMSLRNIFLQPGCLRGSRFRTSHGSDAQLLSIVMISASTSLTSHLINRPTL